MDFLDLLSPCAPFRFCIYDTICITHFTLIPMCLLALAIGVISHRILSQMEFRGSGFYSIVFGMYGCMMTIAMVQHTMLSRSYSIYYVFWMMNATLTSSIAMGYFLAGLADIKVLDYSSLGFKVLVTLSWALIACGWLYSIITEYTSLGFMLYFVLISITCLGYLITQLVFLYRAGDWTGTLNLGLAGIAGIFGILSLLLSQFICNILGFLAPFLTGNFFWYLWSDVAVFFMFLYVAQTSSLRKDTVLPIFNRTVNAQLGIYQTSEFDQQTVLRHQSQVYQQYTPQYYVNQSQTY